MVTTDARIVRTAGPAGVSTHIDDLLGPSAGRFFGSGYQRISQQIQRVTVGADVPPGEALRPQLTGSASVAYPADWSCKGVARQVVPHLSSLDALVLSIRLVEAFLVEVCQLDADQMSRAWLQRCVMKPATTPHLDLETVGLRIIERQSGPSELLPGGRTTDFDCQVGTIRVAYTVQHEKGRMRPESGAVPRQLDPPTTTYHAAGYRLREYAITDVAIDPASRSATADARVRHADVARPAHGEVGARHQPSLTMVDTVIIQAQLAQAVLYGLDTVSRSETNNLWMRKIEMWQDDPAQPVDAPLSCTTYIRRSNIVSVGESRWRLSTFAGGCGLMNVRFALGHQLP